jgi:hypothetical protein
LPRDGWPQLIRNSMDARHVAEVFRDRLEMMREEAPIVPIGKGPDPVIVPISRGAAVPAASNGRQVRLM